MQANLANARNILRPALAQVINGSIVMVCANMYVFGRHNAQDIDKARMHSSPQAQSHCSATKSTQHTRVSLCMLVLTVLPKADRLGTSELHDEPAPAKYAGLPALGVTAIKQLIKL
jgi:hypothetical protein